MENQQETPAGVETDEEFPDEFQCCVCWDLLYKPVVLACGHISCFWCVFRMMKHLVSVSHCPVCRHPYNHFPSICQLLHFMVLKLYPQAYKRREQQVLEEEKRLEWFSPQLVNCFRSESSKGLRICSHLPPHSTNCSCNKPNIEGTEKVPPQQDSMLGGILSRQKNSPQLLITDFHCAACKELLYRPVVLNCGHVYCEVCIISPTDRVPRCQVCQSAHPNGCPKVCLLLKNFLEEQFPEQYALRKENVHEHADSQNRSPSACSIQSLNNAPMLPSISTNPYQSWLSGRGPEVHIGVGCDYCGMYPIIGERYRCKDCKEKSGFDLCEGCYNSSSKFPGRFNQQHTPEHKLENVRLHLVANDVSRLETEEYESDSPDDMDFSPFAPIPEEDSASHMSSDDTSENQEDALSSI
ncbi:E3 ubiquitin-protein ligase PRT1-like isoform X3 [Rhododendron vialii]|uniref:E3 ubiquitin-protein ligase PRT1-like isoform X3 n=1 Tax=Rhododendron vialii TaxID=182163 RepID=UPI00265F1DA2|nr:E3 ubiquitin-protein ligase PRT1-like isoform X3 [Rhododendron vialii]